MPKMTFEYTDFLEDWHALEKKHGKNFRNYAGKKYDGVDTTPYQDFWQSGWEMEKCMNKSV